MADIADAMVANRWMVGKSHRELAEKHGVSISRVEDWATEAGRCIRVMGLVDRETVRAQHRIRIADRTARYVKIADEAELESPAVALKALDSWRAEDSREADLLGLNEPTKVDVHHTASAFEAKPLPAQLAEVEEHIAALEAVRDDLRAQLAIDATPGLTNNVLPATRGE